VIAASTVGSMFIVENAPKIEWDRRIGTLQSWLGAGQVVGLMLAGTLASSHQLVAFEASALALLFGAAIGWRYAPAPGKRVARAEIRPKPAVGGDAAAVHHQSHHLSLSGLRAVVRLPAGGLAKFLGVWLLALAATSAVSTMLPVAMTHEYQTTALLPSAAYAVGMAASLPFYGPSGRWEAATSSYHVMLAGFGGRMVLLAGMAAFGFLHRDWAVWAILAGFVLTQVIWPLLAVGSTTLAVTLNPAHRGAGLGLLNASTAAAGTIGGVLGGLITEEAGYASLCAVACVAVSLAALMGAGGRRDRMA
jgi:hypothetical protein